MKVKSALLALSVALTLSVTTTSALAENIPLREAARIANSVTAASNSEAFKTLENQSRQALLSALQGNATHLTRKHAKHARQSAQQADTDWLKASQYDFQIPQNQLAGIDLLSGFSTLPPGVLQANLQTTETINNHASQATRQQAIADAEGYHFLYYLSDALGPRLGTAFIRAYNKGEISKAAALLKATQISTSAAKEHFNYPRPFRIDGNHIQLVEDDVIVNDHQPYTSGGAAFPSGHTNAGYTDALLLAQMIPERFIPLLERAARYGYSRVVLGVHYPLDVIGSRMITERNVAHYLNDTGYRVLFADARDQLRAALEKECAMPLAQCAQSSAKDDAYRDPSMLKFYQFTMTYNLPQQQLPQQQLPQQKGTTEALQVPQGAEILLESVLPQLSAQQRRDLMIKSALPAGYPLSGHTAEQNFWQRLNLPAAVAMAQEKEKQS